MAPNVTMLDLVTALSKHASTDSEVVAVSLGPQQALDSLRKALAMGADRAIHLSDPAWGQADTLMTARALAAVIKQEAPGLALFGRQAIDDDMGAVLQAGHLRAQLLVAAGRAHDDLRADAVQRSIFTRNPYTVGIEIEAAIAAHLLGQCVSASAAAGAPRSSRSTAMRPVWIGCRARPRKS